MKLYRQVSTTERLPENNKLGLRESYKFTDIGYIQFIEGHFYYKGIIMFPKWWLETIELPTEEEIINKSADSNWSMEGFREGANFILNKIK